MSFLKSLVKEINVAKSMIDIPMLKDERDKLKTDLDKCLVEIEKVSAIESANICETATNFHKYSKYLNQEDQELAKQLSEKMQQYVSNSQIKLSEFLKKKIRCKKRLRPSMIS